MILNLKKNGSKQGRFFNSLYKKRAPFYLGPVWLFQQNSKKVFLSFSFLIKSQLKYLVFLLKYDIVDKN